MKDEEGLHIEYSKLFIKQLKESSLEIKIAFKETRELFSDNPTPTKWTKMSISPPHLMEGCLRNKS